MIILDDIMNKCYNVMKAAGRTPRLFLFGLGVEKRQGGLKKA